MSNSKNFRIELYVLAAISAFYIHFCNLAYANPGSLSTGGGVAFSLGGTGGAVIDTNAFGDEMLYPNQNPQAGAGPGGNSPNTEGAVTRLPGIGPEERNILYRLLNDPSDRAIAEVTADLQSRGVTIEIRKITPTAKHMKNLKAKMDSAPAKAVLAPAKSVKPAGFFENLAGGDGKTVSAGGLRVKRSAESVAGVCRLVPHLIDFNKFGSDWNDFIHPRRFDVQKAEGSCHPFSLAGSTGGVYYTLTRGLPKKCVPIRFEGMQMLYVGQNGVIHSILIPKVVAVEAACR